MDRNVVVEKIERNDLWYNCPFNINSYIMSCLVLVVCDLLYSPSGRTATAVIHTNLWTHFTHSLHVCFSMTPLWNSFTLFSLHRLGMMKIEGARKRNKEKREKKSERRRKREREREREKQNAICCVNFYALHHQLHHTSSVHKNCAVHKNWFTHIWCVWVCVCVLFIDGIIW